MGLKNTVDMLNSIENRVGNIHENLKKEARSLVVRNRGSVLFTRIFPYGGGKTYEVKLSGDKFDIHHVL